MTILVGFLEADSTSNSERWFLIFYDAIAHMADERFRDSDWCFSTSCRGADNHFGHGANIFGTGWRRVRFFSWEDGYGSHVGDVTFDPVESVHVGVG